MKRQLLLKRFVRTSRMAHTNNIPFGPFKTRNLTLSNFLHRVFPRANLIRDTNDFHTLPTPDKAKYHPSSQFIHSVPKYFNIRYNPKSVTDPI
jgi:hypothetical protein